MAIIQPNSVLNSQHVTRRKPGYTVQGANALSDIAQHPLRKKKYPATKIPPPKFQSNTSLNTQTAKRIKFKLTPNFLLIFLTGIAVIFFALYALLWDYDIIEIKPTDNELIRRRLQAYAEANANIKLPIDDFIFNANETFSWRNYSVRKGDTVSKIAADNSLSIDAIIASNDMKNARNLREGEILRIPNMDGIPYTVASGDSLKKIALRFNVPLEAILDANDIQDDNISTGSVFFIPGAKMKTEDLKLALGELFVYPVNGKLTSPYGWRKDPFSGLRRYHRALDLAAPTGSTVKAAMNGKVTTIGRNDTFGIYVIVTHSGGYQSMYAHLNKSDVKQGQSVEQGQKIAEVGTTGLTTGAHLHFAIYKNGIAVNPLDYLKT
ncbi:MAG: M23 family metallopeptidase [Termitinemataceae bacterium]|nr:MAG: M23 family metallopeptidase [Termitinemataceae bacterium]